MERWIRRLTTMVLLVFDVSGCRFAVVTMTMACQAIAFGGTLSWMMWTLRRLSHSLWRMFECFHLFIIHSSLLSAQCHRLVCSHRMLVPRQYSQLTEMRQRFAFVSATAFSCNKLNRKLWWTVYTGIGVFSFVYSSLINLLIVLGENVL